MTISCPSCKQDISEKAFDCPRCGHPMRKPRRGFFGTLFKWTLIAFNLLMIAWLVSYFATFSSTMEGASEAEQTGAAIGGTIGLGIIMTFWVLGDIILGLATVLTRPSK